VLSGLFLYFSQILIKDFNPTNINMMESPFVNFVYNFELYAKMGLILISAFSLTQIQSPSRKWWGHKFLILVVLSTILYATGQDHRSVFWQIIQSLWFYFPILFLFHQYQFWFIKITLAVLLILIYYLSLPFWNNFATIPYLGPILFGGMN